MRFESGKLLFYHDNIINTFVSDVDMSMIELLDFCACKGIYRNTKTVITHDKITIDKGALWKQLIDIQMLIFLHLIFSRSNRITDNVLRV